MAGIAAEDIGKCAYGIFKKGTAMIGKRIGIAGEQLSGNEMAEGFRPRLLASRSCIIKFLLQFTGVLVLRAPMTWEICSSSMMSSSKH